MPNQHKTPMLGWHPESAELAAWARSEAACRDVPLKVILDEALAEYRQRHEAAHEGVGCELGGLVRLRLGSRHVLIQVITRAAVTAASVLLRVRAAHFASVRNIRSSDSRALGRRQARYRNAPRPRTSAATIRQAARSCADTAGEAHQGRNGR